MKHRNGFVSNSSSSSFILPDGDIKEISRRMLNIIIEDYEENYTGKELRRNRVAHKQWIANLNTVLKRKDIKSGEIGITLPSCNYDTYMIIDDSDLYITTCRNHVWNFDISACPYDSKECNKVNDIICGKYYYNIRHKIIHSFEIYDENDENDESQCPKCKQFYGYSVIDQQGNRICATCFKGKLGLSEKMLIEALHKKVKNQLINPITSLDLEE